MRWVISVLISVVGAGLVASSVVGCVPELDGFRVIRPAPGDGGVPLPDDGGTPIATGGPCATPTLLVALQNLGGGTGAVLRYHLASAETLTPCGPLTAGGDLDPLPFAVAAPTERYVLVASRQSVQGIDPIDDRLLFRVTKDGLHPNDAFAIDDPSWGDRVAGVAWSRVGASASERGPLITVETFSAEGSLRYRWDASSALMLGTATAMAASADDPTELLAMNSGVYSAAEVDPYGQVRRDPALVPAFADVVLNTVASARSSTGVRRVAWSITSMGEGAVAMTGDAWSGDLEPSPVTCAETPCRFVHVAVDPSLPNAAWALCEETGGRRTLMRFDYDRLVCEPFLSSDDLDGFRPSYLAIRP